MARVVIPVGQIEFEEGGRTIWVQSTEGTVLRIQLPIPIRIRACSDGAPCSHMDITVTKETLGTIPPTFCLGQDAC